MCDLELSPLKQSFSFNTEREREIAFVTPFWLYSWLSLSRPRLSRITAYLEVNIWSLPKHETLITGNKILWKRVQSNFSSFPQYFQHISNFKSPITYTSVHLLNVVVRIIFILNSANIICRVRISRSILVSSLEFEITRVDWSASDLLYTQIIGAVAKFKNKLCSVFFFYIIILINYFQVFE